MTDGRRLGWGTLWGRHLLAGSFTPVLTLFVLGLSLGISLAALLGVALPLGVGAGPGGVGAGGVEAGASLVLLVDWSCAWLALLVAVFAWGRMPTGSLTAVFVLAPVMPVVALLDAYNALSLGGAWPVTGSGGSAWPGNAWLITRIWLAGWLAVAAWIAGRAPRPTRWMGGPALAALACLAASARAALAFAGAEPGLGRPPGAGVGVPLLLALSLPLAAFVVTGLLLFPALHREDASVMSHALILSVLPQALCQVEALAAVSGIGGAGVHMAAAEQQKLLAYVTILAGIVLDYVHSHRAAARALAQARSARSRLEEQSQEVRRIDRELAERRLEKQWVESQLRMLEKAVETMSIGVTITRPDGRIQYTNPADARMHGYEADELIGRHASIFQVDGSPRDEPPERYELWIRESLNRSRDGRVFPVRLISDAVYDEEGEMRALVTLCEDISEHAAARQALTRRDRILEAVSLAAERFLMKEDWTMSVSEVLSRLGDATGVAAVHLGRRTEAGCELLIERLWTTEPDAPSTLDLMRRGSRLQPALDEHCRAGTALYGDLAEVPEGLRDLMRQTGIASVALVPVMTGGDCWGLLTLESRGERQPWSPSEIEALKAAARILGGAVQSQKAEVALVTSEANYRDLIETANDLIQRVSAGGELLFVNRSWRSVLGYGADEVGSLSWWDVVVPEARPAAEAALRRTLEEGAVERVETVFRTRSGRELAVEGSLVRRSDRGGPPEVLAIFRDVTERKFVDRMKQDFLSTVSHELRTPLTSLLGSLALLRSPRLDSGGERGEELLAMAYRNGERLLRLINDLLDLQKMAVGELSFNLAPTRVEAVLTEAMEGIRGFAESMQVDLALAPIPPGLCVLTDRDRLVQILYNLLSNAIKFSAPGALVEVTAGAREPRMGAGAGSGDGEVAISVRDQGEGIPEEFRQRLFEKFAQADASNTRRVGGSGLGLSIVRSLVDGLGGRIEVDSEVGVGTRVTVVFPRGRPC